MVYFNRPHNAQSKRIKDYDLNCIELGKDTDHARCTNLPVAREAGRQLVDLRKDLAIGVTRSNRPRIDRRKSPDLFLVLSSRPCEEFNPRFDDSTSRGMISLPSGQLLEPLCCGYGFLQAWSECVVKANPGDAFAITISDFTLGWAMTYNRIYLVGKDEVLSVCEYDAYDAYRELLSTINREPPEWLKEDGFDTWRWTNILRHRAMRDIFARRH